MTCLQKRRGRTEQLDEPTRLATFLSLTRALPPSYTQPRPLIHQIPSKRARFCANVDLASSSLGEGLLEGKSVLSTQRYDQMTTYRFVRLAT
jgi:hypothetical protein